MIKSVVFAFMALVAFPLAAQKVGYIDSDLILSKMPEYKSAQKQLDDLAAQWQTEATELQNKLDQLYRDFKAEELLLTADQKRTREEAIVTKEKELFKKLAELRKSDKPGLAKVNQSNFGRRSRR